MNKQIKLVKFLNNRKDDLVFEPQIYSNQLTIAFANVLIPEDLIDIFPVMRLHVERIDETNLKLIEKDLGIFLDRLIDKNQTYKNVWLTTSNITDRRLAMVEISFE